MMSFFKVTWNWKATDHMPLLVSLPHLRLKHWDVILACPPLSPMMLNFNSTAMGPNLQPWIWARKVQLPLPQWWTKLDGSSTPSPSPNSENLQQRWNWPKSAALEFWSEITDSLSEYLGLQARSWLCSREMTSLRNVVVLGLMDCRRSLRPWPP